MCERNGVELRVLSKRKETPREAGKALERDSHPALHVEDGLILSAAPNRPLEEGMQISRAEARRL